MLRFAGFLNAASGDTDLAAELYRWNADVSSALFEVIHHVEVPVRNAVVEQLQRVPQSPKDIPGTPWVQQHQQIKDVKGRLEKAKKMSHSIG